MREVSEYEQQGFDDVIRHPLHCSASDLDNPYDNQSEGKSFKEYKKGAQKATTVRNMLMRFGYSTKLQRR